MKKERFLILAIGSLFALVALLFSQWVFMRFWLYHSQNRNLNAADYEVRVFTPNEYEQMLNPDVRQVRRADGVVLLVKAEDPGWEAKAKSRVKPLYEGKYYVEVTTKGTAHALVYWYGTFLPAVIFSLGALVFLIIYRVKEKTGK